MLTFLIALAVVGAVATVLIFVAPKGWRTRVYAGLKAMGGLAVALVPQVNTFLAAHGIPIDDQKLAAGILFAFGLVTLVLHEITGKPGSLAGTKLGSG